MAYEQKKTRVSVSAIIFLTWRQTLAHFNLQPLQKRAHLTVNLLITLTSVEMHTKPVETERNVVDTYYSTGNG